MFSADFLEPRDFQLFPHPPPVSLLAVVPLGCLLNFPLHRSARQGQKGKNPEHGGIFAQGRREEEQIDLAWGQICLFSLSRPSLQNGSLHVSSGSP